MYKLKKRKQRRILNIVFICIIALLCAGCGAGGGAEPGADSPVLTGCEMRGECSGGIQDQRIIADLTFDRAVVFDENLAEQLRIVIGGQRIDPEDVTVSQSGDDTVEISVPVVQVNDGMMEITNAPDSEVLSGLTDKEGKNCVEKLEIKQLIPSGASVSTIEEGAGSTVCQVDSVVTHRSIIWLRILRDGQVVIPDETDTTDVMDDAAAVHEHEFLWATPESTAADMAETINRYYSSDLEASADGNRLTIREKTGKQSQLKLEIYTGDDMAGGSAAAGAEGGQAAKKADTDRDAEEAE